MIQEQSRLMPLFYFFYIMLLNYSVSFVFFNIIYTMGSKFKWMSRITARILISEQKCKIVHKLCYPNINNNLKKICKVDGIVADGTLMSDGHR